MSRMSVLERVDLEANYFCVGATSNVTIIFTSQIMPYIYVPDRQKITPTEGTDVEMTCKLLFGSENNLTWTWLYNDLPYNVSNDRVAITGIDSSPSYQSRLSIRQIDFDQRGFYQCVLTNAFGTHSRRIQVNVRSMLSPLWPFLGVLVEIGVFIFVLRYCSKKELKMKKKY